MKEKIRVCFGCNNDVHYLSGSIGKLEIPEGDEKRYEKTVY